MEFFFKKSMYHADLIDHRRSVNENDYNHDYRLLVALFRSISKLNLKLFKRKRYLHRARSDGNRTSVFDRTPS